MCYSALFILFIALNLLSMFIGNLVEIIKLPKWLDFKPINCKKCLSTWSSWTLHTIVALSICSWIYFILFSHTSLQDFQEGQLYLF